MRLRTEARVGIIIFLSIVALILIYAFFGRGWIGRGNYTVCAVFDDVLRLSRGADVRLAGVRIGSVQDIGLTGDKKAKVLMTISRKYQDAIREDSTARITTGGLIGVGEYYIEILPGESMTPLPDGKCLQSIKMPNLDDVMSQVTDIVCELKESVSHINKILKDENRQRKLDQILDNVRVTTEHSKMIAQEMQKIVGTSQPQIRQALQNVITATGDFAGTMEYVRKSVEAGDPDAIKKALNGMAATAANFEAASGSLRKLAEDPQISKDIKGTTGDIRQAAASAKEAAAGAACLVQQLQQLTSNVSGKINKIGGILNQGPPAGYVPDIGSRFDFLLLEEDPNFRFDYNYTLPWGYDRFYRLGVTDVGEDTGVNLQAGQSVGDWNAYRLGLFSSKLGVGYDHLFGNRLAFQLDLYDPNDFSYDARLKYDFSDQLRAQLGINNGSALIGVQYRK